MTTTATNTRVASILRDLADVLEGKATLPAPVSTPRTRVAASTPKAAKAKPTTKTAPKAPKAPAQARTLSRKTRAEFVAQNPAFAGMSTAAITEALLAGAEVTGAWNLGEARVAKVLTGEYPTR